MALDTARGALTPHALVYGTRLAVDPQISPDGTRLVYGVARAAEDQPAERPATRLWTSALDGSGARPLTAEEGRPRLARWSGDGTRIAFVAADGDGDGS
ncbi:MAG: PD40 domain-containing protein, partial [Candidatus Dormibacteraeota bacterium]|nr:PD40 domain-containing protein [Candidatus Dormibacteraeota bacterium]